MVGRALLTMFSLRSDHWIARVTSAFCWLLLCGAAHGQATPIANAVKLPDSLIFTATTANNNCTVVWHPVKRRYYSLRIGASGFPLETWVEGSATSVCAATTAIDTRGMWYNPNNGQIERNCLNSLGWATFGIDAASCATGAATTIFSGQLQATGQSCAAYDPVLNQVLSYAAATTSVQFRDRATGNVAQTLLLSGTSFANVNTESIIWTGQAGYEIGLLNWSTKRVLLFDRTTGAFSGQSQLPASAVTHAQFRFCYTNHRVWLYNSTLRKWNAYCIWQQDCATLPVELVGFQAKCVAEGVRIEWSTATEANSSHFIVQRSHDLTTWSELGRIESAGNSLHLVEYAFIDPYPEDAELMYYRLRQVDIDGEEELFPAVSLAPCPDDDDLMVWPNPVSEILQVNAKVGGVDGPGWRMELVDPMGRTLEERALVATDGRIAGEMPMHELNPGVYSLRLKDPSGRPMEQRAVIKH